MPPESEVLAVRGTKKPASKLLESHYFSMVQGMHRRQSTFEGSEYEDSRVYSSVIDDESESSEAFDETENSCVSLDYEDETESSDAPVLLCMTSQPEQPIVKFGTVCIREYERIPSDHPSCSGGAPIGIGWNFVKKLEIDVDLYESAVGPLRKGVPILGKQEREGILREWGFKQRDIAQAARAVYKAKNQRRQTINSATKMYDRWESALENATQKVKQSILPTFRKSNDMDSTLQSLERSLKLAAETPKPPMGPVNRERNSFWSDPSPKSVCKGRVDGPPKPFLNRQMYALEPPSRPSRSESPMCSKKLTLSQAIESLELSLDGNTVVTDMSFGVDSPSLTNIQGEILGSSSDTSSRLVNFPIPSL